MEVVSFEAEKHRRGAMSSRLLLLRLRKHHYEYAPDSMKSRWLPSTIVGDPILNHLISMFENMPAPDTFEMRKVKSSVQAILSITARYYKVAIDEILGPRRIPKVVRARKVAMYLAHEHTTESVVKLSRTFRRDHSTLLHARNTVARALEKDRLFALQVATIRKQLEASWDCPDVEEVKKFRHQLKMSNSRWDIQSEVQLIQGIRNGKSYTDIAKELGVSTAAAFNKHLRLQAAKQAFEAAGQ